MEHLPFARLLDIRITDVGDGWAVGRIELQEKHSSNPQSGIAHGGVPYALADTVAGAAASSVNDSVTPDRTPQQWLLFFSPPAQKVYDTV